MSDVKIYTPPLDMEQIQEIIPHRYPFLLVDRVLEIKDDTIIRGYKNLTANEHFFQGHFPGKPIMPGVLIIEALAQLGAVYILAKPENQGRIAFFMTIENAKFRKPVVPGDRLDLELTILKMKSSFGKVRGVASVNDQVVAETELTFALAPKGK
jgi:3-hydroxyacyl-[acyl-carrier-protein] dehydratase